MYFFTYRCNKSFKKKNLSWHNNKWLFMVMWAVSCVKYSVHKCTSCVERGMFLIINLLLRKVKTGFRVVNAQCNYAS